MTPPFHEEFARMHSPGLPPARPELAIALSGQGAAALPVGLPVLGGEAIEAIFSSAVPAEPAGECLLYRVDGWLLGSVTAEAEAGRKLDEIAQNLYRAILRAVRDRHLCRIWNYVPGINRPTPGFSDQYHAFCHGRSLAFEEEFGRAFTRRLPAASAVGTESDRLSVVFAACAKEPRHCENPHQTPAYEYPSTFGPRTPSFARATVVPGASQSDVFISGTSAILGHATIALGDTLAQLACTLDNLRTISQVCGLGAALGAGRSGTRHLKVYLRHADDYPAVAAALETQLLRPGDHVSFLRADICRAGLNVEIEVTVRGTQLD
jgi:enamine deaminase RidA (YjgF/YER057c/UK114 family)